MEKKSEMKKYETIYNFYREKGGLDIGNVKYIIIIIMLAYLYCAAYTRMPMNHHHHPVNRGALHFSDDGQRMQLARPELPAPHYICMYRLLPTTPHHRLGIITPDLSQVPFYRSRKDE